MRIVITGASGFLGASLSAHFRSRGHEVRSLGPARLGQPASHDAFAEAGCAFHAAHDFAPDAFEPNTAGTRLWFEAAREAGVAHQIFLSSFSARPGSPSRYGRTKLAIEPLFLESGHTVLRPGLVAGPGGMFARFVAQLGRWHLAPLVAADSRTVAVIALADFLEAATQIAERGVRGAYGLFAPDLLTGREFARAVWAGLGTTGIVIPIPTSVAIPALRAIGATGTLDSLRGQLANTTQLHESDLGRFVPHVEPSARAVERAAARSYQR